MKFIVKQNEPQAFSDWKAQANNNWQPSYDNLSGDIKKSVKEALMIEQGYICCYCERRLTEKDSHIEHFKPQSDLAVDPLDFDNMLCSCQNQLKKGEPRHCGNLKGDWYDDTLLISPLGEGCEDRFAYMGDGLIEPRKSNDLAAKETIKHLGLDLPNLNSMRSSVIAPFLDDSLSEEEFQLFVSGYLKQDSAGRFGEFWSAIRYQFGGFATI